MKRRRIKVDPTIVLTRPILQAEAFAADLIAAHGRPLPILVAPLMGIAQVTPDEAIGFPEHVIFTSANAVAQAGHLGIPKRATAWCVGAHTAAAAQAMGFETRTAQGDSAALVDLMIAARPQGEILHLRGAHVTGRVVDALRDAGLTCAARVIYDQVALPPSDVLTSALAGSQPLIVPLFSPRSARLLAQTKPHAAPISLIAMSSTVAAAAESLSTKDVFTVNFPDKNHMIAATLQSFDALCGRKMS
jgi:uroporphyrinogen-III synthase